MAKRLSQSIPGNDGNVYKCPICKTLLQNADVPSFPFCSDKCRLIDLSKWLDGSYTASRPIDPTDQVENLPRTGPTPTQRPPDPAS